MQKLTEAFNEFWSQITTSAAAMPPQVGNCWQPIYDEEQSSLEILISESPFLDSRAMQAFVRQYQCCLPREAIFCDWRLHLQPYVGSCYRFPCLIWSYGRRALSDWSKSFDFDYESHLERCSQSPSVPEGTVSQFHEPCCG